MNDLDKETFICHRCKLKFKHTQGTWLPIGYDYSHQKVEVLRIMDSSIKVINSPDSPKYLQEPPIVTSNDFTCYDCLKETDGDGFLEQRIEDNQYHLDATAIGAISIQ